MKNDGLIQQLLYWLTVFSIFLLVISKLQMSMKNNSKYFYISNENMSDIKESIEEYSQNFQRESVANSKIKQSIAEDISYSRTNKLASQSIPEKNLSKKNIKPPTAPAPTLASAAEPIRKVTEKSFHVEQVNQKEDNRPIDFGEIVWDTIQERYYETNKISTDSPDVLYDFYLLQKRTLKPRTLKVIQEEEAKLEKLMPSAKRKMQNRLDFEKMILYKAEDVLYSLQVAAHMRLRDRQLKKNENILNAELKKTEKKKPKNIQQVVNKLYGQSKTAGFSKTNMNSQDLQKLKLTEFGRKLSEAYQNAMREFPQSKVQSLANLHRYWSELYDRQEYGLDWNEDTVEKDLRNYMIGQVIALKIQYQRKIGYSESNGVKLFKFLVQNPGIQGVYIPPHSLEEYAKVYSLHQSEAEQQAEKAQKAAEENQKHWRTRSQVKKFGRPVSATPLTVLAKPKQKKLYGELYTKYGNDKLINTLIVEERVKVARYPFQYGTYDIVDELKAKNRVVPKDKVNFDQAINKMLTKTINNFSGFFSPDRDRVIEMLQSDGLYKNQNWKEQGDTLQEAMLVKSYENDWLRDPIVNYMKKKDKECQFDDDKTLFGKLFKRLNELSEDERETELDILRRIVDTARQLAKRKEGLGDLQKKDQKFYNNQTKLLNIDLLERVKLFLRKDFQMRTGRSQEKLNRRQFLNQTYALFMKNHKDAVKKYFNAVQFTNEIENKECPKLLKYQFYRLCKEINPENYERDEKPKAPNWVPTKQNPDSFNYKSHNQWTKVYKKDKNKQPMDPEPEQRSQSLWGIKKGKDREKLLMTYQDARECYFHPKVKKLT